MPQPDGVISLEHDTPELARSYDEAGLVQFRHGKFLIGPLAIKSGEHVLDIGTGTGRLAQFVAGLLLFCWSMFFDEDRHPMLEIML